MTPPLSTSWIPIPPLTLSIKPTSIMSLNTPLLTMGPLLIGQGANGGLAGSDVRVLERTGRTVSVTGIDNHELPGLDIVTCAALLPTNHGKVVLIMHEYAYYGRGNTIHSPGQIEWFQNICDDKSFHVGGKQVINFLEGYSTPLQCRTGLMYMSLLGKPTDADLNTYPHVLLTGPHEWDPCVLDYTHPTTSGDPTWAPDPSLLGAHDPRIDDFGNFKGRVQHTHISHLAQHKHAITPQPIDFERLRPYFGWVNKHTIEKTFNKTTQWAVASTRYPMRKHFKSRFPAFNIPRRSEEVATDTIFSDTPAIDSGVTMAQIFVGKRTLVTDVYPLKSQKQFVNTLEDNIRFRGAMTKLISDYAKVEISNKVKGILRMYHSSSWNSEPYHQNQNPAEGRYCTLKSWTNTIMNRSGAPADCWLLCMIHASYILNHLSCEALGGKMPSPTNSLMLTPRRSSTDLLSDPQILPLPTSVWYLMEGRVPRPPNPLSLSGLGKIIVNLLPNPWQNIILMILLVEPSYSQRMNKEKGLEPP